MPSVHKRIHSWECDSCGAVRQIEDVQGAAPAQPPAGWSCIAINHKAADPAWDHDGWRRYTVCQPCLGEIQDGNYELHNQRASRIVEG